MKPEEVNKKFTGRLPGQSYRLTFRKYRSSQGANYLLSLISNGTILVDQTSKELLQRVAEAGRWEGDRTIIITPQLNFPHETFSKLIADELTAFNQI